MDGAWRAPAPGRERAHVDELSDSGRLFHQLNNQLGIILANAELLEAKATDEMNRSRAAQIVTSVLDAMNTARELRSECQSPTPGNRHA